MTQGEGFRIPQALVDEIRKRVQMQSDGDMLSFVSDAVNTYIALGGLVVGGAELQVKNPKDDSVRRVRLPFEQRQAQARPAAGTNPVPVGN